MESKYAAIDIANYIIEIVNDPELGLPKSLSPLKLQKILYYVSCAFSKKNNAFLFEERFEKWQYGPVVPEVYHTFKSNGSSHIRQPFERLEYDISSKKFHVVPFNPVKSKIDMDDSTSQLIKKVTSTLINKSSSELIEMTHQEDAWANFSEQIVARENLKYSLDELVKSTKIL